MNEHDAIARIKRLSHSINCADEIAEVIERLIKERDELRCEVCDWVGNHFKEPPQDVAKRNGWDCFDTGVWDCYNTPKGKLDKTLNGVIIDGGKAVPPKYEDIGDE